MGVRDMWNRLREKKERERQETFVANQAGQRGLARGRAESAREMEREAHARRPRLSDEERDDVVEKARSELPALDRKVEEGVERLRELSKP